MTPSDPLEYTQRKNWSYKLVDSKKGQEINIKVCPYCKDNKNHFYLNSVTGQFFCQKCGQSGSLLTLKKDSNDLAEPISFNNLASAEPVKEFIQEYDEVLEAHQRLLKDKDVLLYLSSRCMSPEAVRHFKLGLSEERGIKWLWFPYLTDDKLKNIKKRTLPPAEKGFIRLIGGESSLYNEEVLQDRLEYVIICEGESDLLSLWSKDFKNVVATPVGAQSIKNEWIDQLDKVPIIYIAYDQDDAGQLGAQKLASRLGIEKCKQIKLPNGYNDINEYFQHGKSAGNFQSLIDNAPAFNVESVESLGELIQRSVHKFNAGEKENKLILPWQNVNKLLDGFVPGDLIVIGAKPGVGKSSFSFNLLYYYATQGIPSLLFSLEMPPWRILPRLVARHLNKDSKLCSDAETLLLAYKELRNVPFYLAHRYSKLNWDFIADTIRHCVKRYGIEFVVFDNLHFLCRSLSHATEEISVMIQNFKLLAEELSIPIVVIARPRKTTSKIIDEDDLKGCVTGGTLISLDGKEFRSIKSLYPKNTAQYKVKSYDNSNNNITYKHANNVIHTGIKKCYRIRTKLGYTLEVSEDSKIFDGTKWIKVSELSLDDKIMIDTSNNPVRKGLHFNSGKTHFMKGIKYSNLGINKGYDHSKVKRKIMRSDFNQKMRLLNPPIGSKLTTSGYLLIYMPDWPSALKGTKQYHGYVYEHVYMMEKKLGRSLLPREKVHHIDGDKQNNDIDNLLLCKSNIEHAIIHAEENRFLHKLIQEGRVIFNAETKTFNLR